MEASNGIRGGENASDPCRETAPTSGLLARDNLRTARHPATTDGYWLLQGGFGKNCGLAVTMKDRSDRLVV